MLPGRTPEANTDSHTSLWKGVERSAPAPPHPPSQRDTSAAANTSLPVNGCSRLRSFLPRSLAAPLLTNLCEKCPSASAAAAAAAFWKSAGVAWRREQRGPPLIPCCGPHAGKIQEGVQWRDGEREGEKGGGGGCGRQMCSLQLGGAEALLAQANQFLRGGFTRSPPTSLYCREEFFFLSFLK